MIEKCNEKNVTFQFLYFGLRYILDEATWMQCHYYFHISVILERSKDRNNPPENCFYERFANLFFSRLLLPVNFECILYIHFRVFSTVFFFVGLQRMWSGFFFLSKYKIYDLDFFFLFGINFCTCVCVLKELCMKKSRYSNDLENDFFLLMMKVST